ncbi:MAG: DUF971 domain-containing protein [Acidobacteria bacterium]|nr:DUF971 domain-containing protein [Acidobacteriota bacterium]
MSGEGSPRPRAIEIFPSGEVGVAWPDGREDYVGARALRLACPCAQCVDEITGTPRLVPGRVPDDIQVVNWAPVGHYAVQFRFSDGHDTGIYGFDYLRRIAGPA